MLYVTCPLFVRLFVNTFYVARLKRLFEIRISNKNVFETSLPPSLSANLNAINIFFSLRRAERGRGGGRHFYSLPYYWQSRKSLHKNLIRFLLDSQDVLRECAKSGVSDLLHRQSNWIYLTLIFILIISHIDHCIKVEGFWLQCLYHPSSRHDPGCFPLQGAFAMRLETCL